MHCPENELNHYEMLDNVLYIDSPRDLLESQALGLMFDAKCNVDKADEQRDQSPVEREATPFDEDFDSDWDSWEEDEEVCYSLFMNFNSTMFCSMK